MALAMMVESRLWLAGVVGSRRDLTLIQTLADQIRAIARCQLLLLSVDDLPSYVKAFQRAFRSKVLGRTGRPRLCAWPDVAIVQVVKRRLSTGLEIERRIVQGCPRQIERLRQRTQGVLGVINTA